MQYMQQGCGGSRATECKAGMHPGWDPRDTSLSTGMFLRHGKESEKQRKLIQTQKEKL